MTADIMDALRQDFAYAIRQLGRSAGFTAVAVFTLAAGIGANTAIFSVVHAVMLRPLPFPEPDRLVRLYQVYEGEPSVFSPPNFLDVQKQTRTLDSAAAFDTSGFTLTRNNESVRLDGAEVTASFFDVLRVRPEIGRPFRVEDHANGRTNVAILSHGLWVDRFGADLNAVGSRITIDQKPYEVVGVMPEGFDYPPGASVWTPFLYDKDFTVQNRGAWFLTTVGRLRPGVSARQAAAELRAIGAQLEKAYPKHNTGVSMTAEPMLDTLVRPIRPALMVLLGAVGLVLLIACVNVANLLLARGIARSAELAVRTALGAGRWRLVRQLFTESVILAVLGGGAGLLIAAWLLDVLVRAQPEGVPRLSDVSIDGPVLAFTAGLSLLTAVLFGLAPALQITRGDLAGALKEGGRSGDAQPGSVRLRQVLVAAEIALALTLLVGAGLLMRSFARLTSVDPGFPIVEALTFRWVVPEAVYKDDAPMADIFARASRAIRTVPGVEEVGASVGLPLTNVHFNLSFDVEGRPPRKPGDSEALEVRVVTPTYFRAIGLPLRRGRLFAETDGPDAPQVVIISESAVRKHFPHEDPLGKKIVLGWGRAEGKPKVGGVVVGIVADAKEHGLSEAFPPEIYVPHAQAPLANMQFIVRTAVPAASITNGLRVRLGEIEPRAAAYRFTSLEQLASASVSQPRFYMLLLAGFASVALVLATVGIFGVMAYAVSQRTREIGIRMALGADPNTVVTMVLKQALPLVAIGIGAGVLLALALSRWLQKLLFNLSPTDPVTMAAVAILLAGVALVAGYLPARRATRIDPLTALRSE